MRRSVLVSIQPYCVFLIIARAMGWNTPWQKTVDIRKNFPKAPDWDKRMIIYCSKSKRSFKRIPKEYQPLMAPLLGKVIGEFVCDDVYKIKHSTYYSWHISDLKIYDKPKELNEFTKFGYLPAGGCCVNGNCKNYIGNGYYEPPQCAIDGCFIKRAPQSWCYIGG